MFAGCFFEPDALKKTIYSVFDPNMSGHHYSSMYHDVKKGRPTEIDYLNGSVINIAKRHGIPVPYNELLFHLIKMMENKKSDY
nr:ketopantoate reductase C-terminal domain-containing protein [Domibacillus antri]